MHCLPLNMVILAILVNFSVPLLNKNLFKDFVSLFVSDRLVGMYTFIHIMLTTMQGYCFKHAVQQGIAHAQLPIAEYVKLNCRTVLAINHGECKILYCDCDVMKESPIICSVPTNVALISCCQAVEV